MSDDDGDDNQDEMPLSAFSIIKKAPNDDEDKPPDRDNGGNGSTDYRQTEEGRSKDESSEFQLVNSRNIEIARSAGSPGCKITYIDFNDSMRNYIAIKGKDGEILNKLLTAAERRGDEPISNVLLQTISTRIPKVWEYSRAVHSALKNWTTGEATNKSYAWS